MQSNFIRFLHAPYIAIRGCITVICAIARIDRAKYGAGTIITKDVLWYAVVGGMPAKILHYLIQPAEIEYLTHLEWWDRDVHWLRENHQLFHDIKIMKKVWIEILRE